MREKLHFYWARGQWHLCHRYRYRTIGGYQCSAMPIASGGTPSAAWREAKRQDMLPAHLCHLGVAA